MPGTYTLLVRLTAQARIRFGATGDRDLEAGWYAYTGSAHGPGGFARVDRHRRVAAGEHDVRHWHIDYLLGHPGTVIDDVERSPGADAECRIAAGIGLEPVPGIGATDCDCDTHLAYAPDRDPLRAAVTGAHRAVDHS